MASTLWQLQSVSLRGRLNDLTLHVPDGVTAVLGASGSGKTSLLNMLVGFERPDAGHIAASLVTSNGRLPLFWSPSNAGLWPHLTTREHLQSVAANGSAGDTTQLLDAFALTHRADARPGEMSLGERSRLSVARALAAKPAVLVMDEPLAHVGQTQALDGWRTIRTHIERTGSSLVFATHNPETVLAEAAHVICLRDGSLAYEGPVSRLYINPPSQQAAECLGLANWFDPADSALWLGRDAAKPFCVRPEHLCAEAEPKSCLAVESVRFRGAVQAINVRHEGTGKTRLFLCRNCDFHVNPGARIKFNRTEITDPPETA